LTRAARPVTENGEGEKGPFVILESRPNPFNPETSISFDLPAGAMVRLSVYDVAGREVRVLADGFLDAGPKRFVWDGRDARGDEVGSGVYFCRIATGGATHTRKVLLLR
jgi:hypothetical protein